MSLSLLNGWNIIVLSCLTVFLCFRIFSFLWLNFFLGTWGRPRKPKFFYKQKASRGFGAREEGGSWGRNYPRKMVEDPAQLHTFIFISSSTPMPHFFFQCTYYLLKCIYFIYCELSTFSFHPQPLKSEVHSTKTKKCSWLHGVSQAAKSEGMVPIRLSPLLTHNCKFKGLQIW